ncbi:MAG: Holliday junction resolvase RuvX [Gemmatimonadetes bacterium]|nr:Holliday junction resolvase RuvX [Gemmatimonadota bacterium]
MHSTHRRVLALDYGLRRIGVAVSDPTGTLASPVTTLKRRAGKRPPISGILDLGSEFGVHGFVVGLPLEESGGENEWTAEVRTFGRRLGARSGLPVHFVDERYSSLEAEARIRSIGLRRKAKEDKARIDAGAAAIFLQDWLDAGGRIDIGEQPGSGGRNDG